MKNPLFTFFLFVFLPFNILLAQETDPGSGEPLKHCGTTEALNKLYKNHPGLQQEVERLDLESMKASRPNSPNGIPVYKVPVVVHVLHQYGPENISDAQVYDAINILRRDFRKQNPDTALVQNSFRNLVADVEVEFYLAQIDPNGNCTNGIDRIVTNKTYDADDDSKLNQWPRNKYLNIWTCSSIGSGAAGYSYYPGSTMNFPEIDGIVILHSYFG